jgi:DNA-binding CsgD family transcriptional regulator
MYKPKNTVEVQNIWKTLTTENKSKEKLQFDLEVYKKLLNVFQVGDFYYIILDLTSGQFDYVSEHTEAVLDIKPEYLTIDVLLSKIHPEDLPYFMNFEHSTCLFVKNLPVEKLKKYKFRYDYRIRKSDGEYIRILQQVVCIEHDDEGNVSKSICVHTDISHLKESGKPLFSIIGMDGEPSYINIDVEQKYIASSFLTKREKQIINLLISGKVSKEIACELSLSINTIETYRKKLLQKTATVTTAELVGKAIREGWV